MSDPIKPRFVSIKQIAEKLEVSDQTVYNNRARLGLHRCRDRVCRTRYFTVKVEKTLRELGHDISF